MTLTPTQRMDREAESSFVPVAQAAEFLNVSTESIRRYLKSGKLRGFQLPGGTWRVYAESVQDLIANGSPDPGVIDPNQQGSRLVPIEGSLRQRSAA